MSSGYEPSCAGDMVGWIIGESTSSHSTILFSPGSIGSVMVGSHVVTYLDGRCVLGVVESIRSGVPLLSADVKDTHSVERLVRDDMEWILDRSRYHHGSVRWVSYVDSLVERGAVDSPKIPPQPANNVFLAGKEVLRRIFSPPGESWMEIGSVLGGGVRYKIDVNRLGRHLAILAVTGGGKSNTVCVLARRMVSSLGATVVIFDRHGEYSDLGLGVERAKLWRPAAVNPVSLSFGELIQLMDLPGSASVQRRIIRWLWTGMMEAYRRKVLGARDVLERAVEVLETAVDKMISGEKTSSKNPLEDAMEKIVGIAPDYKAPTAKLDQFLGVLDKFNDLLEYYRFAINPDMPTDIESIVPPGKATIMDLSMLDDIAADAVVSHYLRRLLRGRINAVKGIQAGEIYRYPVLFVIEEAHILIPKDEHRLTKVWASRVAREGRKFGAGLVIVSQRPKRLDPDVLSQTNNKIILKIVEPQDIRYVQSASEELSEDLASILPSLNTGEALIMGSMTRIPAVVKIDKCETETGGADIDMVAEWRQLREGEEVDLGEYAL